MPFLFSNTGYRSLGSDLKYVFFRKFLSPIKIKVQVTQQPNSYGSTFTWTVSVYFMNMKDSYLTKRKAGWKKVKGHFSVKHHNKNKIPSMK